jgi:hypothetical protein
LVRLRRTNRLTEFGLSIRHFFRRAAFRNIIVRDFALIPFFGDIQIAVTAAELLNVRYTIDTGTNYVPV